MKVVSRNHAGRVIPVEEAIFLIGRHDKCQLRPKSESVDEEVSKIVKSGSPRNGSQANCPTN